MSEVWYIVYTRTLTWYNPVWFVIDPPSIHSDGAACDVVCTRREEETHGTRHLCGGGETVVWVGVGKGCNTETEIRILALMLFTVNDSRRL